MKYLNIILLLMSFSMSAQEWITDDNFDSKINKRKTSSRINKRGF